MRRRLKSPKYSLISVWKGDWGTADLEVCYHGAVSTLDWKVCVWDQERSQRLEEALPAKATKHSATEDEDLSLSRFTASPAVSTAQHWDMLQRETVSHISNWGGEKKEKNLMENKRAARKSLTRSTGKCFHRVNFVSTKVSYTCWYRVVTAGWINEMPVVVWLCRNFSGSSTLHAHHVKP